MVDSLVHSLLYLASTHKYTLYTISTREYTPEVGTSPFRITSSSLVDSAPVLRSPASLPD